MRVTVIGLGTMGAQNRSRRTSALLTKQRPEVAAVVVGFEPHA